MKKFKLKDLDCICLPEEVSVLPDFFLPDTDRIIEYGCTGRASKLTEPLWTENDDLILF